MVFSFPQCEDIYEVLDYDNSTLLGAAVIMTLIGPKFKKVNYLLAHQTLAPFFQRETPQRVGIQTIVKGKIR